LIFIIIILFFSFFALFSTLEDPDSSSDEESVANKSIDEKYVVDLLSELE